MKRRPQRHKNDQLCAYPFISIFILKIGSSIVIIADFALLEQDIELYAGHTCVGSGNGPELSAAFTDPCLGSRMLTWHCRVQLRASLALRITIEPDSGQGTVSVYP